MYMYYFGCDAVTSVVSVVYFFLPQLSQRQPGYFSLSSNHQQQMTQCDFCFIVLSQDLQYSEAWVSHLEG